MLVEHKACLYSKNKDGCYPLHQAAKGGKLEIVKFLLENGATLNPRNSDKRFPISYAIDYTHVDVAKYLKTYTKNVSTSRDQWFHIRPLGRDCYNSMLLNYADELFKNSGNENLPELVCVFAPSFILWFKFPFNSRKPITLQAHF